MSILTKNIFGLVSKGSICLLMLVFPLRLLAHEFWLLPDQFSVGADGSVHIRLQVGEDFAGNNWNGNKNSVMQLLLIEPSGRSVNLESLMSEAIGDSIRIEHAKPGTQMVIYHSIKNYIELKADDFNAYLKEDGLSEALEYRTRQHELDQPAKENYQRCAKTIFYAGNPLQSQVSQPTTLPLDIVPTKNLYGSKTGAVSKIRFVVYFKGQPLANASIKTWHKLPGGEVTEAELKTDSKGRLKLSIAATGTWMISTVKMLHNDGADVPWQSYWGSLTWGY